MRSRTFLCITLVALCHLQLGGQTLTNSVPSPAQSPAAQATGATATVGSAPALPDDPGLELIPVAEPEPIPPNGLPVDWNADRADWAGDTVTLTGHVVFHYRDYTLHADQIVYHRDAATVEAEGHLELTGGPESIDLHATHGDLRLNMHTARFYHVTGTQGIRQANRSTVYVSSTPFQFTGRVLLQLGEGKYQLVDGTMTNCELPHPDWSVMAPSILLEDGMATTRNSFFRLYGLPIFYLPYLRHPMQETGRQSGLLIPVFSNSSIKGIVLGAQIYTVLNRSMDMVVGSEYFSHRGWAPNGDFRYRGPGLDRLQVRWNALLDRGIEQEVGNTLATSTSGSATSTQALVPGPTGMELVNQGGVDIVAEGRKDLNSNTYLAGVMEYLSHYVYRLVFNDNYSQAVSSQVSSKVGLTRNIHGYMPSLLADRFETFASSTNGDEARISHLPTVRFDVVNRPLGNSPFYWELSAAGSYMSRSEPHFHARNVGRIDVYPHLSLPLHADGWSFVPSFAVRTTGYSISQNPNLTDLHQGVPTISHDPLNRIDAEASIDVRPPAVERDFTLPWINRVVRHVIEPDLQYNYVGGIGSQAQHVLLIDTTDIATNTSELFYSLTQRFYARPIHVAPCDATDPAAKCPTQPREWASWTIGQKLYFDSSLGGAILSGRRNVFTTTLDLSGVAFLDSPQNLSPLTSRVRFEAVDNLRVEWDIDYDPRRGQLNSDNLYAGYTAGDTTIGLGHALLNAVDESSGSASTIKSQQLQPFLMLGKPSRAGLNVAVNGGYDFTLGEVQYAGVQTTYNWDCCGLTVGYRRFELGTIRNETQYLYSFTLANFGAVGDIRRSTSVFRDPALPPAF